MRWLMRAAVVVIVLGASSARADVLTRAIAAAGDVANDDLIAWAGTPEAVALPDLLRLAVRQAPPLQNAKIDIEIAEAQISETWARNDWTVKAQLAGSDTTGFAFGTVQPSSQQVSLNVDFTRALPTGATIDLHAGSLYANQPFAVFGMQIANSYWQDTISGSIVQPLLKGRGRILFDASEKKARLAHDAQVLARRAVAINLVQTIVAGYWDLVLAERQVAITEQSLELARERLRVTKIGVAGGKIADAEIPAVEQTIALREEDVLAGQLAVLNASLALRRTVGMPIGAGALGLRVPSDLEAIDRGWQLAELVERAYAASPELAQLGKQEAGATIDIVVNDNGLLPQLDAALSLGPTGIDPGAAVALKDMVELKQFTFQGSLTFSRSLSQYDVRGRSRELRGVRQKIRVNAIDLRAQIAQSVARGAAAVELAKRRVVLSQREIELADRNIRIETDRFNLGRSTNFDVLLRMDELRQAQLRNAQTLVDWHKAETSVMALTGELLPAWGITLE
jgi:outer membrane protein TolC